MAVLWSIEISSKDSNILVVSIANIILAKVEFDWVSFAEGPEVSVLCLHCKLTKVKMADDAEVLNPDAEKRLRQFVSLFDLFS